MITYILFFLTLIYSSQAFRNSANFTHRVAISVSVDGEEKGEFNIGLWRPKLEKSVDNFLGLCLGRSDVKYPSGHKFDLKGLSFYEIMENEYLKSGDISPNHLWGGNQTIYTEGFWRCEQVFYSYEPGILVHSQTDNMDSGSEFFIWITKGELQPFYTPFGLVYKGLDLVKYLIKTAGTNNGKPKREVNITGCKIISK